MTLLLLNCLSKDLNPGTDKVLHSQRMQTAREVVFLVCPPLPSPAGKAQGTKKSSRDTKIQRTLIWGGGTLVSRDTGVTCVGGMIDKVGIRMKWWCHQFQAMQTGVWASSVKHTSSVSEK